MVCLLLRGVIMIWVGWLLIVLVTCYLIICMLIYCFDGLLVGVGIAIIDYVVFVGLDWWCVVWVLVVAFWFGLLVYY